MGRGRAAASASPSPLPIVGEDTKSRSWTGRAKSQILLVRGTAALTLAPVIPALSRDPATARPRGERLFSPLTKESPARGRSPAGCRIGSGMTGIGRSVGVTPNLPLEGRSEKQGRRPKLIRVGVWPGSEHSNTTGARGEPYPHPDRLRFAWLPDLPSRGRLAATYRTCPSPFPIPRIRVTLASMSLIYAIGDVHGRRDLLEVLLAAIREDAGGRAARLVFLGDIIDRGPESRQAMDLVIEALAEFSGSRLILGNHEEFMLTFLDAFHDRATVARQWLANGGEATLRSYGLGTPANPDETAVQLADRCPAHVGALRDAGWKVETETHIFVHGGIDPTLPLAEQDPEITRWIRDKFLSHTGALEKLVVHGHTVTASALPEIYNNRIALDTGAVNTGHLTCGVFLDGAEPRFLATDDHGSKIGVEEIRPLDFR